MVLRKFIADSKTCLERAPPLMEQKTLRASTRWPRLASRSQNHNSTGIVRRTHPSHPTGATLGLHRPAKTDPNGSGFTKTRESRLHGPYPRSGNGGPALCWPGLAFQIFNGSNSEVRKSDFKFPNLYILSILKFEISNIPLQIVCKIFLHFLEDLRNSVTIT